jgi:hypothetical protein
LNLSKKGSSIGIETLQIILGEKPMTQPPVKPNPGPAPVTPRWVKILVAVFIILVLVVVAVHLAGVDFGGHIQHVP